MDDSDRAMLMDINHDTDTILEKIGGDKMGESFDSGLLAGVLNKQGIDPGIVAMLNDRRDKGDWGDGGMLILLFLIILMGGNGLWNRNGGTDGIAGVDRTVVNEANYSRMLDAIGGNREAVAQLAQTLNCDMNAVTSALAGVDKQIAVNQGSIINAVQSCCCNLGNQIQTTACATQRAVESQGCQTRADIQDTRYLIQAQGSAQDTLIQQAFASQNAYLADQFCQIKAREDQREIQALRDKLAEQRDTANTLAILNAIQNKDTIAVSGTAGTTTFSGTGTLS